MRAIDHWKLADVLSTELLETINEMRESPDEALELAPFLSATMAFGQLHATLALAGATALQAYSQGNEDELTDWEAAAGGTS